MHRSCVGSAVVRLVRRRAQAMTAARGVRTEATWATALAVATAVVVFATRTRQQTGDSLSYAFAIREGVGLFHPHHLAFQPLLRAIWIGFGGFGTDASTSVLTVAQVHGAVWAAVGVAAAFVALRRLGLSRGGAAAGAAALAVAQGYWVLATQASPYVPSVACLAVAFAVVAGSDDSPPSARRLAAASIPWAVAVLFHQAHVMWGVPLIAALVAWSPRRAPRLVLAATLPAAAIVLSAYVAAFWSSGSERTLARFVRFATWYTHAPKPQWGSLDNLSVGAGGELLRNQLWNLVAVPSMGVPVATVLFGAVAVVLIGWHVVRIVRHGTLRAVRVLLVTWLAAYWALIVWWVPTETKLYALTVLPIVLLGAILVSDVPCDNPHARRVVRIFTAGVVAAIGAMHLAVIVLPAHQRPKAAFVEAQRILAEVPGECAALVDYEVAQSLRYYFGWRASALGTAALLRAYQDRKLDPVVAAREAACVVVEFEFLRPSLEVMGFDGYSEPRRWLRHLEWLLDVRRDASGAVVDARRFEGFTTAPGHAYLRIGSERTPIDGWVELCARLDAVGAARPGAPSGEISAWYARSRARL